MFIDIHGHALEEVTCPYPPSSGQQFFSTAEQLIARHDRIGIEQGVLMPFCNVENVVCPQSNEEILRIMRKFPGRFIPFCNLDPRACRNSPYAPLGDAIRYYRDKGFRGVGEVSANLPILDPRVQNLFRGTEEARLPLTFHLAPKEGGLYGLIDDAGLPGLEASLQRFPNLNFLGHSQTFWAEISTIHSWDDRFGYPAGPVEEGAVPRMMRKYGNLYGDLSAGSGFNALNRDRAYAIGFLNEFQDRLLFGTDICAPDTETPLVDFLLALRREGAISETVFQKIARKNAERLLKL